MKIFGLVLAVLACNISCNSGLQPATNSALASQANPPATAAGPMGLPVYDHIVIVVEENKDYKQIIDNPKATYINDVLRKEGASLTQMYAEEHYSQGNYFWLFSGSNQNVGFNDKIPKSCFTTSSLGEQLISAGRSFKGYSEDLPEVGSLVEKAGHYARKHVPWISFCNINNDKPITNFRFKDFPAEYSSLPTVSFVIPNLDHDMHDGSIADGDTWLKENIDHYYQWAKQHNSLLILTFDENSRVRPFGGLTNPADHDLDERNQIVTIFAGAHIRHSEKDEGKGVTHVNILRTLEAMYKLDKSGAQQKKAQEAGIADDFIITDVFDVGP